MGMKRKLKVLYVTAEIAPYASTGGLGEVGKSFPEALAGEDVEVRRVMPLYKGINTKLKYITDFVVEMDQGYETCIVKTDAERQEPPTYFIQNDRYFYRDRLYAYEDDGVRFFFFCKAVIEMLKRISFQPDIVHTNDWHTGFLPLLLKKEFPAIKSVFTIHNISYSGYIPASYLSRILTEKEMMQLGYPQWLDFMKAGMIHAKLLTTVSPGYQEEIERQTLRDGLSSLLELRQEKMVGILNGIDAVNYNPEQDGVLEYSFGIETVELKKRNRSLLRAEYGLPDTEKPLLAIITRLDYCKGIDLLIKAINSLDLDTFQLFILGTGNPYYQGLLAGIAAEHPEAIMLECNYSSVLAKKIYAAADIYLMPSLSEPCGLGQQYAMRYGVVPVVNPVGGLKDTVVDDMEHPEYSCGFYMEEWSGEALARAILRAVNAYRTPVWKHYITNAMKQDFSWKHSAEEYIKHYKNLLT
jgi:starch synthase